MSLPIHSPLATARPTTLTQAVAQARHPRDHATAQLEPHREELLRLAQVGESAESLVGGLRLIGIKVGRETMRRWLNRQLGWKPAKRRKPKAKASRPPAAEERTSTALALPAASAEGAIESEPAPQEAPPVVTISPSRLILPGETPEQAFRRRLAALAAHDAALKTAQVTPNGSQAKDVSMPPS